VNITFHYTAHLKNAGDGTEQILSVEDGATLRNCFETLCETISPELRTLLVDASAQLRPAILLCVDNEQKLLDDPAPLRPGAQITLLAAISGG